MLGLCHYGPALLRFWFQTDLGRENSASFLKIQAGKTFSYHGHPVRQFLCSDWSKFDRWVQAENLCSILKVVYFGGVYMTPGRPVPSHGSIFVYMIPPQNVTRVRVTSAWVHPGSCTGATISLRHEISQQYHVNAKRQPVWVWNGSAGRLERVAYA